VQYQAKSNAVSIKLDPLILDNNVGTDSTVAENFIITHDLPVLVEQTVEIESIPIPEKES
jgi:hypothetical protein